MIKSDGLFGAFDNLDRIEPINIASWLQSSPNLISIENYLANRILYPQALPITESELKIDLAILREALKINTLNAKEGAYPLLGDNSFFNFTLRKILIPEKFLQYIPNINLIVWVFIDVLLLAIQKKDWFEDLWTIVLVDDIDEVIGSLLLPQFDKNGAKLEVKVQNKVYSISKGELTIIPCGGQRCEVSYELDHGTLLGKQTNALEVSGGRIGLVVDGRRK